MAIIKNFCSTQQIIFYFELIKSKSLIYRSNQADYLNWFPCEFKLCVEEKVYSFLENPTLSLEGIKSFIKIFENVIMEKKETLKGKYCDVKFKIFEYCATEGEFTIALQNTQNYFEEDAVEMTIWLNAAYYKGDSVGYFQGFRFFVSLNDLKVFSVTLQRQLDELLNEIKL